MTTESESKIETEKTTSSGVNSPELDESGRPTRAAVETAAQAFQIAKAIFDRARELRIDTAGVVAGKYNGDAPFKQELIEDWRNNFSTNFLASIIDRTKPQMMDPIQNADLLTHSSLPSIVERAAEKSRIFGLAITGCIRGWTGWSDFLSMLSQENVLHGNAAPASIDDGNWRPHLFRFDECGLPDGTGQHASKAQLWVGRQRIPLNDFLDLIRDTEAARVAQYNIEGCVEAANSDLTRSGDENAVDKADAVRENIRLSDIHDQHGSKTVDVYHLLVREYSGGVDLWTVTQEDGTEIRHVPKVAERMEDILTLFTIQTGNTRFYGSKGLGRMLANLHIAIERGRCLAKDQQYLSGLVIIRGEAKDFTTLSPIVRHPFILLNKDIAISPERVEFDYTAFETMDAKLVSLAESIAGAFIPPNIDQAGGPNTKIEAAQKAMREMAVRQGVLGRFVRQVYDLVSMIQRSICSEDNLKEAYRIWQDAERKRERGVKVVARKVWGILERVMGVVTGMEPEIETQIADSEAVECIIEMLQQGLTIEEIATMAVRHAAPKDKVANDGGDSDVMNFLTANGGHPLIDQREALVMQGEIMIGKDRTQRLLVKQDDPNVIAVARRQQLMELGFMLAGTEMPVASPDNHQLHRQVIASEFSPIIQSIQQGIATPEIIGAAKLVIQHYMAHLGMDTATSEADRKTEEAVMQDWMKLCMAAEQTIMQRAQATGAKPGEAPPPVHGQPGGGFIKEEIDATAKAADVDLRRQELELEREKFGHQREKDTFNAAKETARMTVDEMRKEAELASRVAAEEAARETERQA